MSKSNWTPADIPDLSRKEIIITGATGGLGYETALVLAGAGASVTLTGRNDAKGSQALAKIRAIHPNAKISYAELNLCSLASVSSFAKNINDSGKAIDVLVNNAGVMAPPARTTTDDGFELQFQTNHLSHFALTGQLLPALRRSTSGARVVNVSSIAARNAAILFEDLQYEKTRYTMGWNAYGQSKLANLLFTFELQRRSNEEGWGLSAIAAHPGLSTTDLVANNVGETSFTGYLFRLVVRPFLSQSSVDGALPQIFAAVSPEAKAGSYYGPNGFYEMKGRQIIEANIPPAAKDLEGAKKFWEISEQLAAFNWPRK